MLGYKAKKKLYNKAFIHKSFNKKNHNEQLEFLGDAILSSIVAWLLFLDYPQEEEGFLSKKRATIVSRKHLNLVGKKIIPEEKIKRNLATKPTSIYGNTLEAIIGVIYIDKGIKETTKFIKKNIYNSEFLEELLNSDYKTRLLKYSQKQNLEIKYKLLKHQGLDHEKEFLVAVFINGKKISHSLASSKKEAEQQSAKKAINQLF